MSLADSPPDLPYPKLPFWNTVSLSYSTYFDHFTDALLASWLWLLVAAVVTGFASWQQWSWLANAMENLGSGLPPQMPRPTPMAVLLNLDNVLLLFAGVSIAVAWHRRMILNEQPGVSGSNLATGNLWRYIVVAIALIVIVFLPAAAFMIPALYFKLSDRIGPQPLPPAFLPILLMIFAAYATGIAVAFRLTLLLPARAIGNTALTFRQAWNRTRGNVWRLIWGMVVTTMPALLIAQIIVVYGMTPPYPGMADVEGFAVRMTVMSTASAVYYLLILPIGIGFLSHAYRHFFVAPLEHP